MADKGKFLQGQLLLDSGQLGGSFFQRTVVLVCKHDAEGAFGLVLNRPLGAVEDLARSLVRSLPPELTARAVLLERVPTW